MVMDEVRAENEARWKALLKAKGLRQSVAARRMGISGAQLTRLLKGDRDWNVIQARAFSMATGIPMTEVLPEREEAAV